MMLAVKKHGQKGKTYHLSNPKTEIIQDLHDNIQEVLKMDILSIAHINGPIAKVDKKQSMIDKGVRVYEPYMINSDPIFDQSNIESIFPVERIKKFSHSLQRFLYQVYVSTRLKETMPLSDKNVADFSRLPEITRFGSFTLSYSALYEFYEAFRLNGVEGFIPFIRADKTAVLVGNPISDNPRAIIRGFIKMCQREGLNPSAVQVTENIAQIFSENEFYLNVLGVETFIDLERYDPALPGKEYQHMRRWRNNARANSIHVEEKHLSRTNKLSVEQISEKWLKRKNNRSELAVILRKMTLDEEPYVRRFFAFCEEKMLGYVFFDPIFESNKVVGYYANIERYYTDKPIHGLLPQIIMTAAERFKKEGIKYLSLGLSPLYLAQSSPFQEHSELRDVFEQFYNESNLYAFKGIKEHKNKYPVKIEIPVYFASRKDSSIDDIFNIFTSIGIFRIEK